MDKNERDSNVGLDFTVSVKFTRRRGDYSDVWEARLSTIAIAVVTAIVLGYIVIQVFQIFSQILRGLGGGQ